MGLILALDRTLHRAYAPVREGNFSLEGLLGFDLHGRTTGIVGTGKIVAIVARIMNGFGKHGLLFNLSANRREETLAVNTNQPIEVPVWPYRFAIYVACFERNEVNNSIGTGRITKLLRSLLTSATV